MVIVTHESHDRVLVGTGKQKDLEASDNRERRRRCEGERHVVPDGGTKTGNARLPTVERRAGGKSRRCEVEDRSRRLDVMSETRMKHDCR